MNVHTSVLSLSSIQKIKSYRAGQNTDLWIYNHFPTESRNNIEGGKVNYRNMPQPTLNYDENEMEI